MSDQQQSESTEVWVKTQWDDKSYVVVLETSDGYRRTLTPDRALAYAAGLYAVVARAEHMAAIMRQMTEALGLSREDARETVLGLHDDLPPLDRKATAPMFFHPAVGLREGKTVPVVVTGLAQDGEPRGYWQIEEAKEQALSVLDAVEAANLDNAYFRSLVGTVGIEKNRAHHAVADLANFR